MPEIVIVARIIPVQGQVGLVRAAIDELASASREEVGNQSYDVFVSPDRNTGILIYEIWSDAEAITNHGRTPHMARFKEIVKGRARISVQKLAEL